MVNIRKKEFHKHNLRTGSNIITDLPSRLYLLHEHPENQYPPINMKNEQAEQKRIEHVVVDGSIYLVFFPVECLNNLVAAISQTNMRGLETDLRQYNDIKNYIMLDNRECVCRHSHWQLFRFQNFHN